MTDFERTKQFLDSLVIEYVDSFNKSITFVSNEIYTTFLFDDEGNFLNFYSS